MWFKNICSHSDKCFEIQLVVIAHMKDVIIWSMFFLAKVSRLFAPFIACLVNGALLLIGTSFANVFFKNERTQCGSTVINTAQADGQRK